MKVVKFTTNLVAGLGSLRDIASILREFGMPNRLLIITGSTKTKSIGDELHNILSGDGFEVDIFSVEGGATVENAEKLVEVSRGFQGVIGVGGGSIIDLAKYVGSRLSIPVISIPTTLSSDAIATPFSVLWSNGKSPAIRTVMPRLVVGDYDVLMSDPHRFVAAGFGDMFAKYTALFDWRLAYWLNDEPYLDFAAQLASSILDLLIKRAKDIARQNYIGIETLFYAEVLDAYLMELAGTTRVAAGSEHLIAFALETLTGKGIHGEQVGLGTIVSAYLQQRDWKMVRELLQTVGAPTTIEELGITKEEAVKALTVAPSMRNWYTILGYRGLTESKAERLLRYTGLAH